MALAGSATPVGTAAFHQRHAQAHPAHVRALQDLRVSSIGLGTYLGDPDDQTDAQYAEAITAAVSLGCNLLDAAINYRCQRSERVIGRTLQRLISDGRARREEIVLCTKGGYVPFDGDAPADPARYLTDTYLASGLIAYDELVAGCHCIAPGYLEDQLRRSLANLQVETIDVYYLHNPEQQLDDVPRDVFMTRLRAAFAWLEAQAAAGRIRFYGTATWNGYRVHAGSREHLSVQALAELAQSVGGGQHHFRAIQLPYNLAMPEACVFKNQRLGDRMVSAIDAATELGLSVVASASLLQRRLTHLPPALAERLPGLSTDAQRALQFVRSTPGLTAALTGMKRRAHVEENLALARVAPLSPDQWQQLFHRTGKRGGDAE